VSLWAEQEAAERILALRRKRHPAAILYVLALDVPEDGSVRIKQDRKNPAHYNVYAAPADFLAWVVR
jgi:hypothetical protein